MAPTKPALLLRLQTRLTVLYASLFAGALLLLALATYAAVAGVAERTVRAELESGATVFNRLWSLRSEQLSEGASLLARDFGFRTAFATGDAPTIGSALENLQERLGVDQAYVIGVDGSVTAATGSADAATARKVAGALLEDEQAAGVLMSGETPYQAISAPIYSPTLAGWIVFAVRLDEDEIRGLERLSSIPLKASVLYRSEGAWLADEALDARDKRLLGAFVDQALAAEAARPGRLELTGEPSIALAMRLPSMEARFPGVLVLRYPLRLALAPYRALAALIVGVGLIGLIGVVIGSWTLARTLTRPISALDDAAQRLQAGLDAEVDIAGDDEVARLGRSFNMMAAGIRARERHITYLALHDGETSLPNRRALEDRLRETRVEGQITFCAACGVERFAEVRGAIGYGLAGKLVEEIGGRLAKSSDCASVGRLSSDVIGVVVTAADEAAALALAGDLIAAFERPVAVSGTTVDIALTVGLAALGPHGDDPGLVIDRASIALDQARHARLRTAVFDEALYGDPASDLSLMSQLREAIATGGLGVHYQPKWDLREGRVTGLEALVRWTHPERGQLSPELFIGMAEETGHIRDLTDCVLDQAMADQATLEGAGWRLKMSVNLSGRLLGDIAFGQALLRKVRSRTGELCLEITETAIIDNEARAEELMEALSGLGVEISIDDYGSGLSSLAYLKRIPASELKIDKAFVTGMARSHRDTLLVRSTVDLAHSLGLKVTAEGVEDPMSLPLLSVMGCDLAQGYAIARPMTLNEILAFLDEKRGDGQGTIPRPRTHTARRPGSGGNARRRVAGAGPG